VLVGWRLLPADRRGASDDTLDIGDYIAEVRVEKDGKADGKSVADVEAMGEGEVRIDRAGARKKRRMVPPPTERVRAGDVLIVEGEPDAIKGLVDVAGIELLDSEGLGTEELRGEGIEVVEAIIKPGSRLAGRTAASARLRRAYGINLLAVARHGKRIGERLGDIRFQVGDVLLLQGPADTLSDSLTEFGCLPLADRPLQIGRGRRLLSAGGIFGAAIAATMFGLVPVHVAFMTAATAVVVVGIVRPGEIYDSIDWPVIVLLGAMIPVGAALETTGGAGLIAGAIASAGRDLAPVWTIALCWSAP
jgi:Trk K+ transport system NAD-binding subunit